jgi:hypothetical protein
MKGMSLIPSESASFPDLVGQHHGYLPPNRRPSPRRRQQQLTAQPTAPPLRKPAEADGSVVRSEVDLAPLEVLTPLADEGGSREEAPLSNQTVEQPVIAPSVPAGAEALERLEPFERLERLESTNNKPAKGEARERHDPPKDAPADTSRSPRVALPIPPQRSPAQMRAKIQAQDVAAPTPARRPRTPVRGLAIAHPAPMVAEKPPSTWASRFPVLNLPRHRLIKLMRFILCETTAVGVLMSAMAFGFSHQIDNWPSLFLKILAAAAAVAAIAVPILCYGLPDD